MTEEQARWLNLKRPEWKAEEYPKSAVMMLRDLKTNDIYIKFLYNKYYYKLILEKDSVTLGQNTMSCSVVRKGLTERLPRKHKWIDLIKEKFIFLVSQDIVSE